MQTEYLQLESLLIYIDTAPVAEKDALKQRTSGPMKWGKIRFLLSVKTRFPSAKPFLYYQKRSIDGAIMQNDYNDDNH